MVDSFGSRDSRDLEDARQGCRRCAGFNLCWRGCRAHPGIEVSPFARAPSTSQLLVGKVHDKASTSWSNPEQETRAWIFSAAGTHHACSSQAPRCKDESTGIRSERMAGIRDEQFRTT